MGDMHRSGAGSSEDAARRRNSSYNGPAVMTPPNGLPAVSGLDTVIPTQRSAPAGPAVPQQSGPPQAPASGVRLCTCGHPEEMHEHYRAGDDCGSCGPATCGSFRVQGEKQENPLRRGWRRLRG